MGLVLALKTSLMGGVFVFLGLDPFFSFYPFFLFSFLRFCFTFVVVVVVVVVVVGGGGGGGEHHLCFVGGLKVQNDFVSPVANKWIREGAQIWRRPCSLSKD